MNAEEFVQALKDGKKLVNLKRNLKADASLIYAMVIHSADITFEFEAIAIESDNQISVFNNGFNVGLIETDNWVVAE